LGALADGEDFAQGVDAMGEEGDGLSAMFFDGDGFDSIDGKRGRQCQQCNQCRELSRIGDVGCFHVEASGFEVAEQGLDGPALAIEGKRAARAPLASEREPP